MTLTKRNRVLCAGRSVKKREAAWRFLYAVETLCLLTLTVWGGGIDGTKAHRVGDGFSAQSFLFKNFDKKSLAVGNSSPHAKQVKPGLKEEKFFRGWTQALGGKERIQRIENIHFRGRIETGGLSGIFE